MKKNILIILMIFILSVSLLLSGCTSVEQTVQDCATFGGTLVKKSNIYYCYNTFHSTPQDLFSCADDFVSYKVDISKFAPDGSVSVAPILVSCGFTEIPIYSMKSEGVCKFFSISDAYLGNTVTATGLGAPSLIRLQNDSGSYKLPVVSSEYDAEGKVWTAEFATIDPLTSQPLVPPGTYSAGCFGDNGTASGGGWTVTISR